MKLRYMFLISIPSGLVISYIISFAFYCANFGTVGDVHFGCVLK